MHVSRNKNPACAIISNLRCNKKKYEITQAASCMGQTSICERIDKNFKLLFKEVLFSCMCNTEKETGVMIKYERGAKVENCVHYLSIYI